MEKKVYIRMKQKVLVARSQSITIGDVATIHAPDQVGKVISRMIIPSLQTNHETYEVIDSFIVAKAINEKLSHLTLHFLGSKDTIIERTEKTSHASIWLVILVWLILFIGTAMTLINFHYDVSMTEVQQQLHYLLTGNKIERPLLLQIPYSIGLGVGMVLFLNHWFKKRLNDEPSPLELELYKYKRDIDDYIIHHENDVND